MHQVPRRLQIEPGLRATQVTNRFHGAVGSRDTSCVQLLRAPRRTLFRCGRLAVNTRKNGLEHNTRIALVAEDQSFDAINRHTHDSRSSATALTPTKVAIRA